MRVGPRRRRMRQTNAPDERARHEQNQDCMASTEPIGTQGAATRPRMASVATGTTQVEITRYDRDAAPAPLPDRVVVEEPLEIRLASEAVATTMRTPGQDAELALGFLLSESVITSREDVGSVAHCGRLGSEGSGNVIDVLPAPGAAWDPDLLGDARRGTITTSSCGICGRRDIDDLIARTGTLDDPIRFSRSVIAGLTDALGDFQPSFDRTGGLHAAGLADNQGRFTIVREDIGRHNAVDKVLGRAVIDGRVPLSGHALVVSGRASFEIVQKAVAAAIPVIVSVSAPSSLAIETARRAGATLVSFARSKSFNVYTRAERILAEDDERA